MGVRDLSSEELMKRICGTSRPNAIPEQLQVLFTGIAQLSLATALKEALGTMLRGSGLSRIRTAGSDTTHRVFGELLEEMPLEDSIRISCFGADFEIDTEHVDGKKVDELRELTANATELWKIVDSELEEMWEEHDDEVAREMERRVLAGETFPDVAEDILRTYVAGRTLDEIYDDFMEMYTPLSPSLSALKDGVPIEDIVA